MKPRQRSKSSPAESRSGRASKDVEASDRAVSQSSGEPLPAWWSWVFGVGLVVATFLAYWPAMHGGFLWDDETHIAGNATLRSADGLSQIWFHPAATFQYLQYYPLTFTVFWAEYHLWGLNTFGYHLVNVFFHATVSLLFWRVLRALNVRGAWLAAGIFALHPVCVMSVAWLTELKNTLSATLALCSAWAYLRAAGLGIYDRAKSGPALDWKFYLLALVLFQLALFAKTAVSFLPVTLLLITWWRGRTLNLRSVAPLIPMVAMAGMIGILTIYVERHSGGASGEKFTLPYISRLLISGRSFWFYLGKIFLPHELTFFYPRWSVDAGVWWQDLLPVVTLLFLAILWLVRGRIGRGPFAAFTHFYVSTSFLVLIVVLYMTRYTFVSDHWQYFGCLSVFALTASGIVWALDRWLVGQVAVKLAVCLALLGGLAALTFHQCGMYTNIEKLWDVTLQRNPSCSVAHNDLGSLLLREGKIDEAKRHFKAVLAADPKDPVANYNMGSALKDSLPADALGYYMNALKAKPDDSDAQEGVGTLFMTMGRFDDALPYLKRAAELQPKNPTVHYNLATALLQKNQTAEAIAEFRTDLELNPRDGMGRANYGTALMQIGQTDQAIDEFKKATGLMTNNAMAHAFLGNALLQKGLLDQAVSEFQIALKIQPGSPLAKSRLLTIDWIWATHPEDNFRNGILALRLGLELEKEFGSRDAAVLGTLAAAYAEIDNFTEAVALASDAVKIASAQSNVELVSRLRDELNAFQNKQPYRDLTLTNSALNR